MKHTPRKRIKASPPEPPPHPPAATGLIPHPQSVLTSLEPPELGPGLWAAQGTRTSPACPHCPWAETIALCYSRSLELKSESSIWFCSVAPRTLATVLGHTAFTCVSVGRPFFVLVTGHNRNRGQGARACFHQGPGVRAGEGWEAAGWPWGPHAWM